MFKFKTEPVKKLKKIWESQTNILVPQILSKKLETSNEKKTMENSKKWSSMQLISGKNEFSVVKKENFISECNENQKESQNAELNINRINSNHGSLKNFFRKRSIQINKSNDPRENMKNVLDEIKKLDYHKQHEKKTHPNILQNKQQVQNFQSNDDIYFHSDLETAKIVKKLKQKFDNKDQSFIKVISQIIF